MIKPVYTPRQQLFVELAESLAEEFEPLAADHDARAAFPVKNFARMRERRYTALTVPAELGGLGANLLELTMAQGRLAAGCGATALAVNMHLSVTGQLARRWRTTGDERLEKLLRSVVTDGEIFAPITAEPGHGLVRSADSTARRVPGGYVVSGRKIFGTNSAIMTRLISMATDHDAPSGPRVLMFNVPADSPGISVEEGSWDMLGMRATRSDAVVLDEVFVPDDAVYLSFPSGALDGSLLQSLFGWAWPTFSAVYLGMAEGAFRFCEAELLRRGWERRPRAQAVVEECLVLIESARAMIQSAAREVMSNRLWRDLGVRDAMARLLLVKITATTNAAAVVDRVMGIMGASALMSGCYLERVCRDVRAGFAHPYTAADATEFLAEASLGLPGPPENPPMTDRLAVYTDARPEGAPPEECSRAQALALVDTLVSAFNTGDLDALDRCVTEDYIHPNPDVPQGRAGLREAVRRWRAGVSDLRLVVEDVMVDGDRVVARMTVSGRHTGPLLGIPPTGREFTFGLIDIWRVRDGLFAEHWDQMDRLTLLRTLGAVP